MVILGVIVFIVAIFGAFVLSSSAGDAGNSNLDILGNGTIEENGTLDVKLSNEDGVALKDKEIHVTVTNSKGKVVFEKSAKTYVNGVANVKLEKVKAGKYDVNVTFDGDENYTASSASGKLVIAKGVVEEDTDNETDTSIVVEDTSSSSSTPAQSSPSQSHSQSSHSSSSSSSSSDESSEDTYYDENGKEIEPVYDEDGNPTYDEEEEN